MSIRTEQEYQEKLNLAKNIQQLILKGKSTIINEAMYSTLKTQLQEYGDSRTTK